MAPGDVADVLGVAGYGRDQSASCEDWLDQRTGDSITVLDKHAVRPLGCSTELRGEVTHRSGHP